MTTRNIDRRLFLKGSLSLPMLAYLNNPQVAQASKTTNAKIVIIGGGAAGITVAARLTRAYDSLDLTIIEPSATHVYQAGQTLVGGGITTIEKLTREEKDYIPKETRWIQKKAVTIDADNNSVTVEGNQKMSYDYLIVAAGLQYDYEKIEGLSRSDIGKDGIHSIYDLQGSAKTWEGIQSLTKQGGRAIFTHPATPIKCGGAPKKIMYLAEDYARNKGRREALTLDLIDSSGKLFGVPEFEQAIQNDFETRGMNYQLNHELVSIDQAKKEATFKSIKEEQGEWDPILEEHEIVRKEVFVNEKYDFIHIPPPMSAPDVVKNSALAWQSGKLGALGYVQVDQHTLQHPKYTNVFCLGDVAGTPFGKTGGTVRKQAPIVVDNLMAVIEGKEPIKKFDGYTVCPIITKYGKVMLAEFDYTGKPTPMIPLDPTKERWLWWVLKVYLLEPMYYYGMLRGLA